MVQRIKDTLDGIASVWYSDTFGDAIWVMPKFDYLKSI